MHSNEWLEQIIELDSRTTHVYIHRKAKVKVIYTSRGPKAEMLFKNLREAIRNYVDSELQWTKFGTTLGVLGSARNLRDCIADTIDAVSEDVIGVDEEIEHLLRVLERLHRDRGGKGKLPKKFMRRLLLSLVKTAKRRA